MTKYLLTGDGRRLLTGGGQVLTADAPGAAFSGVTAAPMPVSIKLAAKVAAVAVATVAPMAMAFGLAASPKGSTGIKPMPVTFGLSASPSAWASAELEPAAVEFGLAASPSATAKIVPAPAAVEFGLHASPSIAYPFAIRPQSMPVEMRLTAKPTRAAVIRPRPLTLTTALSANISVSTAAKFLEKWLNVYGLRQAVLNAIDANNRELAKQAGDKATANAAAIVLTNSRVETAEGLITAEAERTTLLQGQINDPATGLAANASGLGSLRTTVEQQGGQITAQSQDITKLRASVGATSGNLIGNAGFESDTFGWVIASDSLVGNVAESTYKLYRNRNGQRPGGINVLTWQSTATLSGGTVVVRSNSVPAAAGTRYCVQCAGDRQASSNLSFGVDFLNSSGGTISGGPSAVVPQGYVTESAFAVAPAGTVALRFWLRSQVTGSVSAPAFSVIRPMVSVAAAEQTAVPPWQPSASGVDEKYAQVTQLLSVEVNSLGQAKALWGMYLDVNGRVVGMQSINDGVRGEINFMTDVFRVMSPVGANNGMEWQAGYLRTWAGSAQAVLGAGFGTDNLMLYLGPNVGAGAAKKSNAAMWADKDGNAGFSGSITSSVLSSSAIALASSRIFCGGDRTAPFVIKDVARSSGAIGNKTATSRPLLAPDNGSGYDYSRMSEKVKDVYLTIMSVSGGGSGNETYSIEVQIDGGAWAVLGSETVGVISTVTHVFTYTYTTPANWSTLAFRARTTQGHTYHLVLNIEVQNFNTTGSAPGTFSDNSIAPPPPPPPAGGGGGSYCVDYETARLPDGRWVRDLQLGDEIGCWNDDPDVPAVTVQAVRAFALGEEECFQLVAASGARVIQSRSTPMTLRCGATAYTPDMLGEEVLVSRAGVLAWETVVGLESVGVRRVVKLNVGDRMYFAGTDPGATIATHNIAKQETIQQPP